MQSAWLEDQFQRELDLSAEGGRGIKSARAANRRSVLIKECVVGEGRVEIGMIEHVEKLSSKLEVQILFDFIVFENGEIKIH